MARDTEHVNCRCTLASCLRASVRAQVRVLGHDYAAALLDELDPDMLPEVYGGLCTTPLHESPEEKTLLAMVRFARMLCQ
jgi:hypothetical protein